MFQPLLPPPLRRPTGDNVDDWNAHYLYIEIAWLGIAIATLSFNSVLAVRLGASDFLVGLVSALPPLIAALFTLPSARWLEAQRNLMPALVKSIVGYRLGFLAMALMPSVVHNQQALALVIIIGLMNMAFGPINIAFNAIFAAVVPEGRRAEVVAWRNILLAAVVTTTSLIAGRALDLIPFPLGYQLFYLTGFLTGLVSLYYVSRVKVPDVVQPPRTAERPSISPRAVWRTLQTSPSLKRVTGNTLPHALGLWMAAPLYSLLYVREMGASNTWVGAQAAIVSLTGMLGYFLVRRWVRRYGTGRVLSWSMLLSGFFPLLVGLSPSLELILALSALYGLAFSSLTLSHYNTLLKTLPEERRAMSLAVYTMLVQLCAFASPLLGVAAANIVGVRPMLVVAGLLWIVSGVLFFRRPPEAAMSAPTSSATAARA